MIDAKKIVIDVNGLLSIQRKHDTTPRPVVCPYRPGHHYCENWCPHFGDGDDEYVIELTCGFGSRIAAPEALPKPPNNSRSELFRNLMRIPRPIWNF